MSPPSIRYSCLPILLIACAGNPDSGSGGRSSEHQNPSLEQRFESSGPAEIQAVSSRADGTIVVSGYFRGEVDLGLGATESGGEADGFVAALDMAGEALWMRTVSGSSEGTAADVVVAPDGTIYVTGLASGVANIFGAEVELDAGSAAYLASLGPDGELLWVETFGESGFQAGVALALDGNDGVFVTGDFTGALTLGEAHHTALGTQDVFVAAFSSAGEARWSRAISGPAMQAAQKVAGTAAGVLVMTYADGDIEIDGQLIVAGNGQYQPVALTELDASGAHLWTRVITGNAELHQSHDHHLERSRSLVVAPDGSVDVALSFEHGIDHTFEIPNPPEVQLVHLDPDGTAQPARPLGLQDGYQDNGGALLIDGELRVAGSFFGNMLLGANVVQAETRSAFVMKPGNPDDPGFVFGDAATSLVVTGMSRDAAGRILLAGFWRPSGTAESHPLLLAFPAN